MSRGKGDDELIAKCYGVDQIWLPSRAVLANNVFANILGGFRAAEQNPSFLERTTSKSPLLA